MCSRRKGKAVRSHRVQEELVRGLPKGWQWAAGHTGMRFLAQVLKWALWQFPLECFIVKVYQKWHPLKTSKLTRNGFRCQFKSVRLKYYTVSIMWKSRTNRESKPEQGCLPKMWAQMSWEEAHGTSLTVAMLGALKGFGYLLCTIKWYT